MAYPDNPEVVSSYSFQIYGWKGLTSTNKLANCETLKIMEIKSSKI
jgi:hypothetical protein